MQLDPGVNQVTRELPPGVRMTPQRIAILREVRDAGGHMTAGEIYERVREKNPTVAYGTVYRTLHLLAEHGVILEFPFGDQASRFDGRIERHDHVHCTVCGQLKDVDVPSALLARHVAEEQTGFAIDGHQTIFIGICPKCQVDAREGSF
ncbi:transcriptional repressor [soil metagenome]